MKTKCPKCSHEFEVDDDDPLFSDRVREMLEKAGSVSPEQRMTLVSDLIREELGKSGFAASPEQVSTLGVMFAMASAMGKK